MEKDLLHSTPREATNDIKVLAAILLYAADKEVRKRMAALKKRNPGKHALVRDQLRQLRESQGG